MTNSVDYRKFSCGFPEEGEDFEKRHQLFLERFPKLIAALNAAFIRQTTLSEHIDKFVFLYGRLCCEDFFEIGLCSGNGYGAAALKLLRTLYERAITLRYLHEHPEELADFWDFHLISSYKLIAPIEETLGPNSLPPERRAKLQADRDEVKERFMVTACETCGTKKPNHTWSKLDFVSMARKTGGLGKLIIPAYYVPLRHAHATVGGLLSRIEDTETEEGLSFSPTSQRNEADDALRTAHHLIIDVLDVQENRFHIDGLKEQIEGLYGDFIDIYGKPKAEEGEADEGSPASADSSGV